MSEEKQLSQDSLDKRGKVQNEKKSCLTEYSR